MGTGEAEEMRARLRVLLLALACWGFTAGPAEALPLALTLETSPDILSGFLDVTYGAGTDGFVATGFALEIDDDGVGPAISINGGTFGLAATIDGSGSLAPGGTLSIGGTIPSLGFLSGTLLTGQLTAFGFPGGGGSPFEFVFAVTGGDAAGLFGGGPGGTILQFSGFGGSFAGDFDNLIAGTPGTGSGTSDTGVPIPEPGTLVLLLMGIGAAAGLRAGGALRTDDSR